MLGSMISVIIPTVQKKTKVLAKLVDILSEDSAVEEILIINNKPDIPLKLNGEKLKIYTPERNLYVNPSWNLGIGKIKNESFVLMNDDLLVCENFCKMIAESDVFNSLTTGLIGVFPGSINRFANTDTLELPPAGNEPVFIPLTRYLGTGDWGVAIFGKKENYYNIPDDLKIIYGDNYLLLKNLRNNKKNYAISNLVFNHIHSASSASPEFSSIIREDIKNSDKYFRVENKKERPEYTLEFKDNICIIRIGGNTSIYLKYKDENGIYSQELLSGQMLSLAKKTEMSLIFEIVKEIINRKTSG